MKFLNNGIRKFVKKGNYYTYGYDGQSASVFMKDGRWSATVDHFATTQLFYSDNFISPSFKEIVDAEKELGTKLTTDRITTGQLKYLKRHTVGPGTIYNQIKRVEENWKPFLNQDLIEYDIEEEYERFCYLLDLHKGKEITVGLSGGRDSAWLVMFLKHRGFNPNLIHITSPNNYNGIDDICCDRYRKEMGWEIENFEVDFIHDVYDEEDKVFTEFWSDSIYPLKSHSVSKHKGIKMSGESSESDHSKKIQWMKDMGVVDDDIYITEYIKRMFNNDTYYGRGMENFDTKVWKVQDESMDYIYEYYRKILKELKDHPLKHNIFWIPSYQSSRLYQESQDHRNEWFAPFADRELQKINIFKKETRQSNLSNSMKKKKLYNMGEKYFGKEWSGLSWDYDIVGMGIPFDTEQMLQRKIYTSKKEKGLRVTNSGMNPLGIFILKDAKTAQYFANNIWIQNAKFDIVSEDYEFPKNEKLRDKLWKEIRENKTLMIIPLGITNTELFNNVKSPNVMSLFNNLIKSQIGYADWQEGDKKLPTPLPLVNSMKIINQSMKDSFHLNLTPQNLMVLAEFIGLNIKDPDHLKNTTLPVYDDLYGNFNMWEYDRKYNTVKPSWKSILSLGVDPDLIYTVKEITFEDILEGWKQLWPDRKDTPNVSTWTLMKECFFYDNVVIVKDMIDHDINIKTTEDVNYYGVYENEKLIGVNSGHKTCQISWRSRGLWVHPDYRGRRISKMLLNAVVDSADTQYVWSVPKTASIKSYESIGFIKRSDEIVTAQDKNYIVILNKKTLDNDEN